MFKQKLSKKVLMLIVITVFFMSVYAEVGFASPLAAQYSFSIPATDTLGTRHSSDFTLNSGVASVTGWQTSPNGDPTMQYLISRHYWWGYNDVTSFKTVTGTYTSSSWFPKLTWTGLTQASNYSLTIFLKKSITTNGGGNIYDGY